MIVSALFFAAVSAWPQSTSTSLPVPPERGKSLKISVDGQPGIVYSIYIPKSFDSSRQTAVLFSCSPIGNAFPLATGAVDELGWISVGLPSLDSDQKDDLAVIADVRRRFSLLPRGMYFAGFSRGSALANTLVRTFRQDVGGVMCIEGYSLASLPQIPQVLISGNLDGRSSREYEDIIRGSDFDDARWFAFIVFNGGHTWGTPEARDAGLRWLASIRSEAGFLSGS